MPKLEKSVIIGHKNINLITQKQRPDEKKVWSKVLVLIVTSFVARTKKCYGVPSPALLYYKYCLFFFILSIRPCPRHSSLSFQSVLILVPCFTFGIRPGVHSSLSSQYILVSFYLSFNPSFYYSPYFFFLSFLSVLFLARASFLSFQFVLLYSSLFSFFIISIRPTFSTCFILWIRPHFFFFIFSISPSLRLSF